MPSPNTGPGDVSSAFEAAVQGNEQVSIATGSGSTESENGYSSPCNGNLLKYDVTDFDPSALTATDCSIDSTTATNFMSVAFAAARDALTNQEVPVGCVFARAGHLLASGRNTVNETKNATRHAEVNCVDLVYERCAAAGISPDGLWQGTDVFVTVEPCVMCVAALIQLGVRSVTYGAANQRFGGCGSVVDVPGTLMPSPVRFAQDETRVEEAVGLLKDFYKGENPNVPRP